ncbi:MAG: DUF4124 domain-containing protein [Gammaproteobacteria bacterium]|nr:MAG: DUF4124 domain-containing protein [Gammaproteobacteria bacterium]UCH39421.1 MAG: DUF4124 domain-containing protein [Gammaproteobacteria bacterium]
MTEHLASSMKITLMMMTMLLCLVSGSTSAAALYKWIDEDGNVRYSDRLPAAQAKKKHHQLNSQGMVVSTTEDARSEEDLAAEAEARRKKEEEEKEAARLKAIQDQKDQVLLLTFSSEKELQIARDDRIQVVDSVIRLINKSIATTQIKLDELRSVADKSYLSKGKQVPGGLEQKIEHFTRKIESRNQQLSLKVAEKEKINQQYEIDLARYRELKSEADSKTN